MKTESPSLAAALSENKSALVVEWFQQMLQTYPESSGNFLSRQLDPFRNPVGHTLKEGLPILFDGLIQSTAASVIQSAMDSIIRIRAVQDIPASQAVAFMFLLKRIIRTELPKDSGRFADEFAALEVRIDEMVLLAFDLFTKCREQIAEIKANESRRKGFLVERIHLKGTAEPGNETR